MSHAIPPGALTTVHEAFTAARSKLDHAIAFWPFKHDEASQLINRACLLLNYLTALEEENTRLRIQLAQAKAPPDHRWYPGAPLPDQPCADTWVQPMAPISPWWTPADPVQVDPLHPGQATWVTPDRQAIKLPTLLTRRRT